MHHLLRIRWDIFPYHWCQPVTPTHRCGCGSPPCVGLDKGKTPPGSTSILYPYLDALTGRSRSADICPNWLSPTRGVTRLLLTSLHIHSQSRIYNYVRAFHCTYCCSKRPGFHCTAVLGVRAFTVLLFYSYPNNTQTGIPMNLPIYPPNTIPQHFYIDSNNTLYWLNK